MGITRRKFVIRVAVGVAGLPLLRSLSFAQTKGKLGYMKIVDNAAMFVAMEKGFFKAEGLELETVPMAGGAVIVQGVTSGDLQIGWTNVISLYQAHVEGFNFKLVAGGATNVRGTNESHAIQVLKSSPIKSAKDLEGKTIAIRAINRGVDAIHADPEGTRNSMVKWAGLPADLAGKIGLPVFEKGLSEKDIQGTIDLTAKYKMIARAFKANEVVSELAPKA